MQVSKEHRGRAKRLRSLWIASRWFKEREHPLYRRPPGSKASKTATGSSSLGTSTSLQPNRPKCGDSHLIAPVGALCHRISESYRRGSSNQAVELRVLEKRLQVTVGACHHPHPPAANTNDVVEMDVVKDKRAQELDLDSTPFESPLDVRARSVWTHARDSSVGITCQVWPSQTHIGHLSHSFPAWVSVYDANSFENADITSYPEALRKSTHKALRGLPLGLPRLVILARKAVQATVPTSYRALMSKHARASSLFDISSTTIV